MMHWKINLTFSSRIEQHKELELLLKFFQNFELRLELKYKIGKVLELELKSYFFELSNGLPTTHNSICIFLQRRPISLPFYLERERNIPARNHATHLLIYGVSRKIIFPWQSPHLFEKHNKISPEKSSDSDKILEYFGLRNHDFKHRFHEIISVYPLIVDVRLRSLLAVFLTQLLKSVSNQFVVE